jgi:DNA-binding NarL/FixJ family response regulator
MIISPPSFLLTDDHGLILVGLHNIISLHFPQALIETSKTAEEAISKLSETGWDFIITDVSLPGKSGIDLLKVVKEKYPECKTIVLTQHTEIWIIKQLVEVGINAIVLKSNEQDEIIRAIHSVIDGKNYYSETVYKLIFDILQKNTVKEGIPGLTDRENDILKLIATGLTSKQIAERLFISEKTVEVHRKNLFVKFDVKNSASLIHKAMEFKFI